MKKYCLVIHFLIGFAIFCPAIIAKSYTYEDSEGYQYTLEIIYPSRGVLSGPGRM